jgi:hypothetical protein
MRVRAVARLKAANHYPFNYDLVFEREMLREEIKAYNTLLGDDINEFLDKAARRVP